MKFSPKTTKAKSLVKKINQFNKLLEELNSEETQEILNNDFSIKKGEKYELGKNKIGIHSIKIEWNRK